MPNILAQVSVAQLTGRKTGIIIYDTGEIYYHTDWSLAGGLPVVFKDVAYSAIYPVVGVKYVGTVNLLEEIKKYTPFHFKWGDFEEFEYIVDDASKYETREEFLIELFDGKTAIALA